MAGKPGRPFNTDSDFVLSKKIINEAIKNKKWIFKNINNARVVLEELLLSSDTPHGVRKSIAEFILSKYDQYHQEQGNKVPKKKKEQTMSLTFNNTGTDT